MSDSTSEQVLPASATQTPRLLGLDFTRGIAVLGILAANIIAFGQPFSAYMWPDGFVAPHADDAGWMWVAQFVLIDGKMRGLFTLLFGAGLVLFMEKAWAKGQTRWLQARRLAFLLIFGLIHFFFIWRGDILILYSIAGFAAMACLRWSAKAQLRAGILGYIAGMLFYAMFMGPAYFVAETEWGEQAAMAEMREGLAQGKAEDMAERAAEIPILTQGSYADFVSHNVTAHAGDIGFMLFLFIFETLPLMLIGMGLFRYGFFSGELDPAKQRMWGWIGIIAGTLMTVPIALWAQSIGFTYWGTLSAFVGFSGLPRLPVIIGLAALLALWGPKATGWLGQRFTAAGRMAFTNYLGTSVLMMLIFHPWAGGLWGELNRPQLYIVVLVAWAIMLLWSKPWLSHFRFGPLEWLWRCLTYGKLFPLKR
ncbi:DUF418 domain-containing protein [Pontixanthobacter aestiaquae]|uniref:DUF418 domain-containing protein n=1 Tax=Pontixanthobacter aestiaquae TaxID=1509367 RepID=A0A844Z2C2_9SPHN|nr:DUF418 domain-containing protein [Pontixanthobacter aestiaquae]MDN3646157.1 DUF418 domain-containing protein [Pontixanthobacter aestiaquae]MXO82851.1 DUF418 domain-containing protein [Pontixanthobacter aestiaquae]